MLAGEVRFTHRGERHFFPPRGAQGGGDGLCARSRIYRAQGGVEEVPSKLMTTLHKGDRVVLETAGGAGHGSAGERPREAVLDDVADGKVTAPPPSGSQDREPGRPR